MAYDFLVLFPVNPKALKEYRAAFSVSGAKDDSTDAPRTRHQAATRHQARTENRSVLRPIPICPWWPLVWSQRLHVRVADDGKAPVGSQRLSIDVPPRGMVIRNLRPDVQHLLPPLCPRPQSQTHRSAPLPSLLTLSAFGRTLCSSFECYTTQFFGGAVFWGLSDFGKLIDYSSRT